MTSGDTEFMTYSACPSTSDMNAVMRSSIARCSGVATTAISPEPSPWPRTTFTSSPTAVGQPLPQHGRVGVDGVGERRDLVEHVLAQPRHGGELHAVGDLVQADPEPEVARVDLELPLDGDQVRRDQQQLAARPVEELELAEHLAGQEADDERRPGRR